MSFATGQLDLRKAEIALAALPPDLWRAYAVPLFEYVRALRAALQPFAEIAKTVPPDMDDDLNLVRLLAAGDFRRAAAALIAVPDGEDR